MTVFGQNYARFYDALYTDKDYKSECESIEKIIDSKLSGKVNILDAGCGTGNHTAILCKRKDYNITGLDRSEHMLNVANEKIPDVPFIKGDIRDSGRIFDNESFDVVLTMAAVLCYLIDTDDLIAAFKATKKILKIGGLYIFDVWFGPAVCYMGTRKHYKDIIIDGQPYVRQSESSLDIMQNTCEVKYAISGSTVATVEENHLVRYYFPVEIKYYLEQCGFKLLKMGQSPNYELELDRTCWHMMVIAESI